MDSGGIFCLHYSCCGGPEVSAGLLYSADVYTLLRAANYGGEEPEAETPLGAAGGDFAKPANGCDGQRGCKVSAAPRI